MENKMKRQGGFTLIELVIVIVILGILAATALPKFVDLSGDAEQASVQGVAGAISGGNNINFVTYLARRTVIDGSAATPGGAVVDTSGGCELDTAQALMGGGSVDIETDPATYQITAAADLDMGASTECTLTHINSEKFATFVLTGAI